MGEISSSISIRKQGRRSAAKWLGFLPSPATQGKFTFVKGVIYHGDLKLSIREIFCTA
jgi:hypothetical protein